MQLSARITVSMFVLISAAVSAAPSSAKLRRDGVLNLYPFPRVGRAHHTWQVPLNELLTESDPPSKRQLYAFPRVGRGDFTHSEEFQPTWNKLNLLLRELIGQERNHYVKRGSESERESTGMWFGPRVGRSFTSYDDQNDVKDHSDPEELEVDQMQRKKRQTKET